ncbi:nuclear transport factor 2 family protein [Microlunatus elymi]|uniref:Nuclear transport factor 2 family protein n=1 Tax=Microlunatus elymi TaxID=2596828 RepID=A0A516Q2U4_9ACTN|nr:nuclear transport factor 2 family protein [Microlunatus elymi]QDP97728.1 nuclear transport factor 2 family protein [Microlunatus elymi]QDP97998.1 nuclear transport factor 2 family protein [Microlunatus elymi]
MSGPDTGAVISRFNQAFVDHDPALLADLVGADCVMESVQPAPDGGRYEGRDACLAFWQALASDRTTQFEPERIDAGEGHGTILWRYRFGTGEGDYVRGVNVMRVADGVVVEALGYSKTPGEQPIPLAAQ